MSSMNKEINVLCFGASLVQGYNSGPENTPYAKWMLAKLQSQQPAKHFDVTVDGVAGDLATVAFTPRMSRHCKLQSNAFFCFYTRVSFYLLPMFIKTNLAISFRCLCVYLQAAIKPLCAL